MGDELVPVSTSGEGAPFRVTLPKGLGLGDFDVLQKVLIAGSVLKVVMGRLVMVHQKKGLLLIPSILQPVEGDVGDDVGGVFSLKLDRVFLPWLVPANAELGIEV